jgi:hypothetical protein
MLSEGTTILKGKFIDLKNKPILQASIRVVNKP